MEDQQQLSIAVDLYCLHSCGIFSGYVSQTVFYAGRDRKWYSSMDKDNCLYPVHFPRLPVFAVGLRFPAGAVRFFLGEGEKAV